MLAMVLARDPYPAVRRIAWRSLRAPLGLEWSAFDPTGTPSERAAQVRALPLGEVAGPDPVLAAQLRSHASSRAIAIGE